MTFKAKNFYVIISEEEFPSPTQQWKCLVRKQDVHVSPCCSSGFRHGLLAVVGVQQGYYTVTTIWGYAAEIHNFVSHSKDFILNIAKFLFFFFSLEKETHHFLKLSSLPRCDLNSMNHLNPTFWMNQNFSEANIWTNETKCFL